MIWGTPISTSIWVLGNHVRHGKILRPSSMAALIFSDQSHILKLLPALVFMVTSLCLMAKYAKCNLSMAG
jgi:hypothetical protein